MARVVKKPEERKEELLEIALKLFLQKGYENTSIKDIYTEANGSFGMFYHHFKSKEEIFALSMDKYVNIFIDRLVDALLDDAIPYEQRYNKAIIRLIEFLNGRDKVIGYERGDLDVSVFRLLSLKILGESVNIVQLFLEEGSKKGLLQVENVHQSAIIITYGIYGVIREEGLRMSNNKNALSVLSNLSTQIANLVNSDKALFEVRVDGEKMEGKENA